MNIFVECTERSPEEIEKELDQIYRLKSLYSEQKKIPKDVPVNFLTKKLKDEKIKQSFLNLIEYKGKKVLIRRELPKQVILESKRFRKLTDKLRGGNLRFRWEFPMGVSSKLFI